MSEEHCPHCGCESYDDETTCADTIAELQSELASYMESDSNLRKKVEELEVLNRRLTERWEGAKLRYAEDSQRLAELEAEVKLVNDNCDYWADKCTALEFKAKAYDAMCDVGLIQFGDDPETRCYSVWGFGAWHHDPDILKAIAAAMDAPILIGKESEDE